MQMLAYSELVERFIENMVAIDRSKATIVSYRKNLALFEHFLTTKFNGPLFVNEISTKDIDDFAHWLKTDKQYGAESRQNCIYTIRSLYKYAYKREYVDRNIALGADIVKVSRKEREYLTAEEVDKLINAIDHELISVVIRTLFYTGLRISECVNLTLEAVNFEKKIIFVIGGKGNKDRKIPMSAKLYELLKDYKENQRPNIDSDYFFATEKTGRISAAHINRVLGDTVRKLGWKKKVSAHILRHSFASALVANGVHLVNIQKLLGHSSLKTTSVYTHVTMDQLDESVNVL